jgi:hypothetical protein
MFASIFYDRYMKREAGEVAYAITDLFTPFNLQVYGWCPASVYLFWNPATGEPLYVGYSLNIGRRFAEHNGLTTCDFPACKYHQINEYFEQNEHIAISLLVAGKEIRVLDPADLEDADKVTALNDPFTIEKRYVTDIEARLINTFIRATGKKPQWNENLGSVAGRELMIPADIKALMAMAGQVSPLAAKGPLRQIASHPMYETAEHFLHGHRLVLVNAGMWPQPGMIPKSWNPDDPEHGQRIEEYLKQRPFAWR